MGMRLCLWVCLRTPFMSGAYGGKRRLPSPWHWSYRWLWANVWVLRTDLTLGQSSQCSEPTSLCCSQHNNVFKLTSSSNDLTSQSDLWGPLEETWHGIFLKKILGVSWCFCSLISKGMLQIMFHLEIPQFTYNSTTRILKSVTHQTGWLL